MSLNNAGDTIRLVNAENQPEDEVDYAAVSEKQRCQRVGADKTLTCED